MAKQKKSGPAIFMYTVIAITVVTALVCFGLYYGGVTESGVVLWVGIVAFMIMYHFWVRIIMGNVSKLFKIDRNAWWFREKSFEKQLYRLLRVRKWKDKVLTYNPESFSLERHTLDEIADTMTKSEVDHWINEIISLASLLFSLIWGQFPIFLVTAVAAMLFDAQFIIVQRYNRPVVLRVMGRKASKNAKTAF